MLTLAPESWHAFRNVLPPASVEYCHHEQEGPIPPPLVPALLHNVGSLARLGEKKLNRLFFKDDGELQDWFMRLCIFIRCWSPDGRRVGKHGLLTRGLPGGVIFVLPSPGQAPGQIVEPTPPSHSRAGEHANNMYRNITQAGKYSVRCADGTKHIPGEDSLELFERLHGQNAPLVWLGEAMVACLDNAEFKATFDKLLQGDEVSTDELEEMERTLQEAIDKVMGPENWDKEYAGAYTIYKSLIGELEMKDDPLLRKILVPAIQGALDNNKFSEAELISAVNELVKEIEQAVKEIERQKDMDPMAIIKRLGKALYLYREQDLLLNILISSIAFIVLFSMRKDRWSLKLKKPVAMAILAGFAANYGINLVADSPQFKQIIDSLPQVRDLVIPALLCCVLPLVFSSMILVAATTRRH